MEVVRPRGPAKRWKRRYVLRHHPDDLCRIVNRWRRFPASRPFTVTSTPTRSRAVVVRAFRQQPGASSIDGLTVQPIHAVSLATANQARHAAGMTSFVRQASSGSLAALEEDGSREESACRARPACRFLERTWATLAHSASSLSMAARTLCALALAWRSPARASSIDCCRVYVSHSAANASNVAVVASVSNALRGERFRSSGQVSSDRSAAQQSHFAEAEALDCKAATKNARQQARRYCRIGEGDVHHQQAKCTMERSAMEAETFEHGIGTMAQQQQEKVPRDCEGGRTAAHAVGSNT